MSGNYQHLIVYLKIILGAVMRFIFLNILTCFITVNLHAQYVVQYRGVNYSVPSNSYINSNDGKRVWCGINYESWQTTGEDICAGGRYDSWQTSAGRVSCGGRYDSWQTFSGQVSCGGQYDSWQTFSGDLCAGGQYDSWQSFSGKVAVGGRYGSWQSFGGNFSNPIIEYMKNRNPSMKKDIFPFQ